MTIQPSGSPDRRQHALRRHLRRLRHPSVSGLGAQRQLGRILFSQPPREGCHWSCRAGRSRASEHGAPARLRALWNITPCRPWLEAISGSQSYMRRFYHGRMFTATPEIAKAMAGFDRACHGMVFGGWRSDNNCFEPVPPFLSRLALNPRHAGAPMQNAPVHFLLNRSIDSQISEEPLTSVRPSRTISS